MNPKVDTYLSSVDKWQDELEKLRMIILDCGLTEELKWGVPCYTFQNRNVVIMGGLKEYCVLSFFKGALLNDSNGILVKAGENTQSGRLIRFTHVREIARMEPVLKAYVYEAVEVEKAGVAVSIKRNAEPIPKEFQIKLDKTAALKTGWYALTPGRQRAYLLYFNAAKQSKTRLSRIERCVPKILKGKGIDDDYLKARKAR